MVTQKTQNNKTIEQKESELENLYQRLESAASKKSLPLAEAATDIVPGEGPATAEVIFIGEAPGAQEAVDRRPFVGRSGKLFRKVLEEESGIQPSQVYISNIVKVRPPDNRDPNIEELEAYKEYLDEEIKILAPKLIVTLGRFSMAKFLPSVKISQVHGRLHKVQYEGSTYYILPMYHPAAALRATKTKNAFIEDFKKIPKIIPWIKEQQQKLSSPKKETKLTSLQREFAKSDVSDEELKAQIIEHLFSK
jgi:DNA polymerase